MHRHPVASSSLSAIGYDAKRRLMEVEFLTGRIYRYLDVPAEAWQALMAAPSLGRHYNECVRDRYEAVEITPEATRSPPSRRG